MSGEIYPAPIVEPLPGYDDEGQPLAEPMPTEPTDVDQADVEEAKRKAGVKD